MHLKGVNAYIRYLTIPSVFMVRVFPAKRRRWRRWIIELSWMYTLVYIHDDSWLWIQCTYSYTCIWCDLHWDYGLHLVMPAGSWQSHKLCTPIPFHSASLTSYVPQFHSSVPVSQAMHPNSIPQCQSRSWLMRLGLGTYPTLCRGPIRF